MWEGSHRSWLESCPVPHRIRSIRAALALLAAPRPAWACGEAEFAAIAGGPIAFAVDASGIGKGAGARLDQAVAWLTAHPECTVTLQGHSDEPGCPVSPGAGVSRNGRVKLVPGK